MFNKFKPTWMIESIYDLQPAELKARGIKVVLTDLDNTLIAWNNPLGTPQLREWLEVMKKAELPVVVVSNNNHQRVKKAVAPFGLPFISRALKPLGRGIKLAKKQFDVQDSELVLVGDQLLTDIAAANHTNIRSILVKPIVQTDAWNTRINRGIEKIVKKQLLKQGDLKESWGHTLNDWTK